MLLQLASLLTNFLPLLARWLRCVSFIIDSLPFQIEPITKRSPSAIVFCWQESGNDDMTKYQYRAKNRESLDFSADSFVLITFDNSTDCLKNIEKLEKSMATVNWNQMDRFHQGFANDRQALLLLTSLIEPPVIMSLSISLLLFSLSPPA